MSKQPPIIRCLARSKQKYFRVVMFASMPANPRKDGDEIARFIGQGDAWSFAMLKREQMTHDAALPCVLIAIR